MAFKTGIAQNTSDFLDILLDFIQNDPQLVADGQNWRIAWEATTGDRVGKDYVVAGPGMMGVETFVALRKVEESSTSQGLWMRMIDGINIANTDNYANHMNTSERVGVATDANAFTYWMMANGRRFMFIIKISTNYQHGYAGQFLQYNQPQRYPNPQMIGGSVVTFAALNWRSAATAYQGERYISFTRPVLSRENVNTTLYSTLIMRKPTNEYANVSRDDETHCLGPWAFGDSIFQGARNSTNDYYGHQSLAVMDVPMFGGATLLKPFTLNFSTGNVTLAGIIDGIKMVNGAGQYSENTIVEDGVTYLVIQDGSTVGTNNYTAWAME